eukprot:4130130-Heterocapsa_arctica.AAC.1
MERRELIHGRRYASPILRVWDASSSPSTRCSRSAEARHALGERALVRPEGGDGRARSGLSRPQSLWPY